MKRLFYNLGRKVGPHFRKAKWILQSMTGSEAEAIKAEHEVGQDLARQVRGQLRPDGESRGVRGEQAPQVQLRGCGRW